MPTIPELVDLGFAVCEVAPPLDDGSCSCRLRLECPSPGKHPVGKGWLRYAVRWRERYPGRVPIYARLVPHSSYGLVPVRGSRLVVIDRDDPSTLLPIPETYEVHRASAPPGKGHYYGVLADGIDEDDVPRTFAGGEVRVAESGHVVGAGSRHASGDVYAGNDNDVATFDLELIDALRALRPVSHAANGQIEAVLGSRHAFLVGQARKLAGWGRDAEAIADELRSMNEGYCQPPLTEAEAEFERMAAWAAANVKPDEPIRLRFGFHERREQQP